MVRRMGGRRTVDKKRRKNFILGSPDSDNYLDRFLFPFLEVGSRISELLSNYPNRNANYTAGKNASV